MRSMVVVVVLVVVVVEVVVVVVGTGTGSSTSTFKRLTTPVMTETTTGESPHSTTPPSLPLPMDQV